MHKHAHGCFLHTNLQNNLRIKMHRDSHAEAHTHTQKPLLAVIHVFIWGYEHTSTCAYTHTQAHTLLAQQWSRLPIAESQIHLASALSLLSLSPSLPLSSSICSLPRCSSSSLSPGCQRRNQVFFFSSSTFCLPIFFLPSIFVSNSLSFCFYICFEPLSVCISHSFNRTTLTLHADYCAFTNCV